MRAIGSRRRFALAGVSFLAAHGVFASVSDLSMGRRLCWLLVGLFGCCGPGCFTPPRCQPPIATPAPQPAETTASATPVQIERGQPNKFLDRTGQVLGVPRQLLLWNRRVSNHNVSSHTEEMVAGYLAVNDLPEVLVRVNEYAPRAEWKRLRNNRRVGAGWRYTVGALDVLLYTLRPGRLFGDDWYNPFTDTINLYSDVPAIALHEAAYAKNIHQRRHPGTYAVVQHLPLVGMWYRTNATREALQYLEQHDRALAESPEANRVLFPMYGGALGGQIAQFVPIPFAGLALNVTGTGIGHIVGRYRLHQNQQKEQEAETALQPKDGSETILPVSATEAPLDSSSKPSTAVYTSPRPCFDPAR
jgi:hypothetical protein